MSEVKFIDTETSEEILTLNGSLLTSSSLGEFEITCNLCGESYKISEIHSCKETIAERFARLEKEIELLKLENKQLRKEMKWL